jgi:hypothetical protein
MSLLKADTVAVLWAGSGWYRIFDRWGRCLAVVPDHNLSIDGVVLGWGEHFLDRDGLALSVERGHGRGSRSTFFLQPVVARVWSGAPGREFVGSYESVGRGRFLDLAGEVLGSWEKSRADRGLCVATPERDILARDVAAQARVRGASFISILEFTPLADPSIRGLILAGAICEMIQQEADSHVE